MNLIMDPDVQTVAEFMQSNLPANRLVDVSGSLSKLAEVLWGHYERVAAPSVQLTLPQVTSLQQPTASESPPERGSVDGGSAVAAGACE